LGASPTRSTSDGEVAFSTLVTTAEVSTIAHVTRIWTREAVTEEHTKAHLSM
jgi:hypothetical protein